MDIKQYIGSGILEDYVLGMTSEQEKREVQCLSKIYPEIASYIAEMEDELAGAVLVDSVAPPQDLKAKILNNLPDREEEDSSPVSETPVIKMVTLEEKVEEKSSDSSKSKFPYGMAAAFAVIIGLGGLYFNATRSNTALEEALVSAQTSNTLADQLNADLQSENTQLAADLQMVSDPETQRISLNGLPGHEGAQVLVFWNSTNQKVMLEKLNLPSAPEGQQYQLWTLVDGQPIDQGVLPLEFDGLTELKSADAADAFAITLEPIGGSESPTLDQLIVLGEV